MYPALELTVIRFLNKRVLLFGDHKGGDEGLPYCQQHMDAYNKTKELAERIVLEANGKNGLLTVALRPSGIRYLQFFFSFGES